MWDIGIIFASIMFFVIAGAYARGCNWLSKKGPHD
jgi:hypothetical protein